MSPGRDHEENLGKHVKDLMHERHNPDNVTLPRMLVHGSTTRAEQMTTREDAQAAGIWRSPTARAKVMINMWVLHCFSHLSLYMSYTCAPNLLEFVKSHCHHMTGRVLVLPA
jgi:hypothetical protein